MWRWASTAEEFAADDLEESGYADAAPEAQTLTEQLLAEAESLGIDTKALRRDVARATERQCNEEFHRQVQAEATRAIAQARRYVARGDAGPDQAGNEDRGRLAGDQGEELQGLIAPTPEVLKANADRARTPEAADSAEQKCLADKPSAKHPRLTRWRDCQQIVSASASAECQPNLLGTREHQCRPQLRVTKAGCRPTCPTAAAPALSILSLERFIRDQKDRTRLMCAGRHPVTQQLPKAIGLCDASTLQAPPTPLLARTQAAPSGRGGPLLATLELPRLKIEAVRTYSTFRLSTQMARCAARPAKGRACQATNSMMAQELKFNRERQECGGERQRDTVVTCPPADMPTLVGRRSGGS